MATRSPSDGHGARVAAGWLRGCGRCRPGWASGRCRRPRPARRRRSVARRWHRRASSRRAARPAPRASARPPTRPRSRRCTARRAGPPASAASALALTVASVSPRPWRRSEWPTMTAVAPASASIGALIEPVKAPLACSWQSWPPTTMPVPASWAATSPRTVNGGNTPSVAVRRPPRSAKRRGQRAAVGAQAVHLPVAEHDRPRQNSSSDPLFAEVARVVTHRVRPFQRAATPAGVAVWARWPICSSARVGAYEHPSRATPTTAALTHARTSLRKHATGWVAKVLFGILVVSFAIWGIGDIFRAPHAGSTAGRGRRHRHPGPRGQQRVRHPTARRCSSSTAPISTAVRR